jgi:hypothetical protein
VFGDVDGDEPDGGEELDRSHPEDALGVVVVDAGGEIPAGVEPAGAKMDADGAEPGGTEVAGGDVRIPGIPDGDE